MAEEEERKKKKKHQPSKLLLQSSYFSFKPSSEVKGLRFGSQFITKSFTIRRARTLELLKLLSLPPPPSQTLNKKLLVPFPSTTVFVPTNLTILAYHAWHTLTLGLGTKKSKVVVFVFENEAVKKKVEENWPLEISLGEVNKKLIRALKGFEMARFKFRKGCVTFYVYAVRRQVDGLGFSCVEDLRIILQSLVSLNDFLDHTAMLATPKQRSISFSHPHHHVAMAH
ncbi:uncharacterized protein LOC129293992 [Prosopis cineraria]|uniref:uncharacterized protein LOC129293992 n=1 Tax=Prosopis cineraria TaxID=364024 RepID=UPI00240F36BA|nr:uncharacterized protein LOC129293992 [Prosopis cineraria]